MASYAGGSGRWSSASTPSSNGAGGGGPSPSAQPHVHAGAPPSHPASGAVPSAAGSISHAAYQHAPAPPSGYDAFDSSLVQGQYHHLPPHQTQGAPPLPLPPAQAYLHPLPQQQQQQQQQGYIPQGQNTAHQGIQPQYQRVDHPQDLYHGNGGGAQRGPGQFHQQAQHSHPSHLPHQHPLHPHQQQQQHHQMSSVNALLGLKRSHPNSGTSTPVHGELHHAPQGKKQRRQSTTSRQDVGGGGSSDEEDDSEDDEDGEEDESEAGGAAVKGKPKGKGKEPTKITPTGGINGKAKPIEVGPDGKKPKATRGSRACTVCRKLKMRCFSEGGPPCKRCKSTNQECIFEESNRGKKSTKKHEAMAQSLKKMEQTLDTVLRSIHNPSMAAFASGMVTRSPSPSGGVRGRPPLPNMLSNGQALPGIQSIDHGQQVYASAPPRALRHPQPAFYAPPGHGAPFPMHHSNMPSLSSGPSSTSGHSHGALPPPAPPPPPARAHSPRLHSLPDNSLNPLGLLAEASLHNHRRVEARAGGMMVRNLLNDDGPAAGAPAKDNAGANEAGGAAEAVAEQAGMEEEAEKEIAYCNSILARRAVGNGPSSGLRGRPASPTAGDSVAVPSKDGDKSDDGKKGAEKEGRAAGEEEKVVKDEPLAEDVPVGLASTVYFKPGPMTMLPLRRIIIERSIRPEILDFLSTEEVLELFDIYFQYINVQCPVLDRNFHTPGLVASRSPFLLTTVCWVAAKFYEKRPELVGRLNTCVRKLAFDTPSHGFKSVEIVQAYLILTCYGLPVERFELDQAWLLLGMGIRVATDLNLHRKSQLSGKDSDEAKARDREIINRERTWLMCYVLDRSLSSQMGKPYSIREDFIIRNKTTWAGCSQYATFTDRGLVAYVGLQQIMSRALDFIYSGTSSASGLNTDIDYPLFLRSVEAQLSIWDTEWHDAWDLLYADAAKEIKPQLGHSRAIGSFYCSYSLLLLNSFGLQNALEKAHIELGHFFARVAGAAMEVIKVARDDLAPVGKLTYAPDSTFTMLSYAILSLLKLLRPALAIYLESPNKILEVVHGAVKVLEDVAINAHHTPALHAQLLRSLLSSAESRPNSVPNTPFPANSRYQTRQNSPMPAETTTGTDPTLANGMMSAAEGTSPAYTDWAAALGGSFPEGDDFFNAGYSTFGGLDGGWGSDSVMNGGGGEGLSLDAIWPANSGIFDSHVLPGFNPALEITGGTISFANGGSFTPQVTSPTQSHARRMAGGG